MWTAICIIALFIIVIGVVECKKCPYKKWLCYSADESKECSAQRRDMYMETGKSGQQTPRRIDDAVSTVTKSK